MRSADGWTERLQRLEQTLRALDDFGEVRPTHRELELVRSAQMQLETLTPNERAAWQESGRTSGAHRS